jgi:hypothetical protein
MPTTYRPFALEAARSTVAFTLLTFAACHGGDGAAATPLGFDAGEQVGELQEVRDASVSVAMGEPAPEAGQDAGLLPADIPEECSALSARPADDAMPDIFCKGTRTTVSSLRELLRRLEIKTLPDDMDEASAAQLEVADMGAPVGHAVLLGQSTALSGRLVSPINPRTIRTARPPDPGLRKPSQRCARPDHLAGALQHCARAHGPGRAGARCPARGSARGRCTRHAAPRCGSSTQRARRGWPSIC